MACYARPNVLKYNGLGEVDLINRRALEKQAETSSVATALRTISPSFRTRPLPGARSLVARTKFEGAHHFPLSWQGIFRGEPDHAFVL